MYTLAHSSLLIISIAIHRYMVDGMTPTRQNAKTILVTSPDQQIFKVTLLHLSDSRLYEMQIQMCCVFDTPLYVSFVLHE